MKREAGTTLIRLQDKFFRSGVRNNSRNNSNARSVPFFNFDFLICIINLLRRVYEESVRKKVTESKKVVKKGQLKR